MPVIIFNKVDFPLPDLPTIETNCPRSMFKSMPLRTVNSPAALENFFTKPRNSMIASGEASCTRAGAVFREVRGGAFTFICASELSSYQMQVQVLQQSIHHLQSSGNVKTFLPNHYHVSP